ncbi:MAG: restriction endonuclease subunit S [Candidatus Pacebacteria bacterium]|nr:restriction endonuclease subunit S [Candidatus Paceibacterota bacterium]
MKKQTKNQNLPKGWRKMKLGEMLSLIIDHRGKTPKKLGGRWSINGISALSAKNIKAGQIVNKKDIKFVSEELYAKWMPEKLETGDILMTSEAPLGELLYLKEKVDYCLSQRLFGLRTDKTLLNSKFLYYYLQSPRGRHELIRRISGTAAEGIRQAELRQLEVIFPKDISEQKRIASILSAFDDKIELNNKINQTLEQIAQAIFKEWFVKSEKLGGEIKNIEDIFIFEKGIEPGSKYYSEVKKEGYIPFYRVRDLDKPVGVDVYVPKEITKDKICQENDVLLSLDATIGRVKIGCNGSFSSGIRKVYSKDGFVKNSFIYFWLKTPYVQNTILEHASGTTIMHAGQSIKYLQFYFNEKIVEKIQTKIDPIFNKILHMQKENQKLAELRDLLLPKLMSGEIRV